MEQSPDSPFEPIHEIICRITRSYSWSFRFGSGMNDSSQRLSRRNTDMRFLIFAAAISLFASPTDNVLRAEEGSLYRALHRVEEAGWIRARWITKDTGRRARLYELITAGGKKVSAEESRWQAVTSAVNRVLRMA
jgi:PadR family transcriptional regulator PadR